MLTMFGDQLEVTYETTTKDNTRANPRRAKVPTITKHGDAQGGLA